MLSFRISKKFAPFKHTEVNAIPAYYPPEIAPLFVVLQIHMFWSSTNPVIGKIHSKISAQYYDPA